ncbi:hypothetical protein SESBI_42356 [Sesbania bispinosa]|nr:hypothetical protein SESBI_42356 [Sesbania bispinosa]
MIPSAAYSSSLSASSSSWFPSSRAVIFSPSSPRVARCSMYSWPCRGTTLKARSRISPGIGSGKLLVTFS